MVSLCLQLTADGERLDLLQFRRGVDIRGEIVHSGSCFRHDDPQIGAREIELLIGVNRVLFEVISIRRKIILS